MAADRHFAARLRKDPAVRAILHNWRQLTGGRSPPRGRRASPAAASSPGHPEPALGARNSPGRGTLIACSGGADSCALVLALAAAGRGPNTGRLVVGHIVHDLRTEREALADRDAAQALAASLDLEFAEARVRVRNSGRNLEAAAREARYAALARIAADRGLRFVATAHHGDDQLETVLMLFLRGTGAFGVRGIRSSRRLTGSIRLIRPMLTNAAMVDRAACRRICTVAEVGWREDATNTDTTGLRAAIRHRVLPVLRELRPRVALRAVAAAEVARDAEVRLARAARRLLEIAERPPEVRECAWDRRLLRAQAPVVLGQLLRTTRRSLCGRQGADRVSKRTLDAAVRAIRDSGTEPRPLIVGNMQIALTARTVRCSPREQGR